MARPTRQSAMRSPGSVGRHWPGKFSAAILTIGPLSLANDRSMATALPLLHSLRAGGLTFAEDPAHSCASVLPVWSRAADPRVLAVRATPLAEGKHGWAAHPFNLDLFPDHSLVDDGQEHVRIDHPDGVIRLDVISGSLRAGPVTLAFEIEYDDRLSIQLSAARDFDMAISGEGMGSPGPERLAGLLTALHAVDARAAGASLRNSADLLLGAGDWPGNGEYRKSRIRRMIAVGEQLLRAGPLPILAMG
jgi:hypothetical protein